LREDEEIDELKEREMGLVEEERFEK